MKSFFDLRENKQITEAVRVSRKDFDKLKKGSMITIDYGSSIKGSTKRTFMVKGKSRSAKYNVDKINMVDPQKPGGMKFHLYSRGGEDATLALGDMGATINSYSIKESIEEKRDAGKSATGYDIYHDTYSAAMQHAYAHAKKKHGVTVRPDEIDSKVASGPRKPSTGKTVSHILKTDKKQNLHVQVYNTGRKYELNMYVESVNEASKVPAGMKFIASYVYKDANGKDHTHTHLRKGKKMTDPVVVHIDGKEWKTFQSFTKAKQAAISHIKSMNESVELDEATMSDKAGPGKGKDMRDMSKLDHAKARDYHQYRVKSKGDYHSKMAKIHHANAIGGSSMLHKEEVEVDEAKVRGADAYDKTFANRKQADKFAREMGGRVKQVGRVFYVFKEEVDEASILRTKTTRKQSDASKEKDRKKAVKTFQDIRKGKYPGVKIGEETLDEASIQDIQGILTTIAKSQNMNQAVQMVMKKYKVDQGKAKAMVKKAIDSGVTYDKIKKKYAKEDVELDELSTDLKKRYVDKAKDSKDRHRKIAKDYATRSDKDAWTDKMSKSHARSANNRVKGIQRATEATYQGKKVPLNKPMAGDVKKSKVYVDPDGDGKAKKVNFGDKNMTIKKNIPARRKSFRARHNCDNPGPKDKARYWSCKAW